MCIPTPFLSGAPPSLLCRRGTRIARRHPDNNIRWCIGRSRRHNTLRSHTANALNGTITAKNNINNRFIIHPRCHRKTPPNYRRLEVRNYNFQKIAGLFNIFATLQPLLGSEAFFVPTDTENYGLRRPGVAKHHTNVKFIRLK